MFFADYFKAINLNKNLFQEGDIFQLISNEEFKKEKYKFILLPKNLVQFFNTEKEIIL